MSKTSRDFETENQITEVMMEKWGYNRRQAFSNRKKNISISGFEVYQPLSLPKLKQTPQQQEGFRFYYGEHKNYLKMAQKIFNQFNHVVSGKKRKKQSEIIQVKPIDAKKSTIQQIEDKIELTKDQISRTQVNDLRKQFKGNNKLNGLFRQFYSKASEQKQKSYSYKDIPLNTYDSGKFRKQLHFKPPKMNYVFVKQKKKPQQILQPFQNQFEKSYLQSQKVEIKISQQRQVIDLYKSRVDQIKSNYMKNNRSLQEMSLSFDKTIQQPVDTIENCQMFEMKMSQPDEQINIDKLAANVARKEQIFTKILKNKNLKYVKQKGTNSLVKYNQRREAKQLLSGKLGRTSRAINQTQLKKSPEPNQDYDLQTMGGPPRKIPFNKDYNAQYRNEKLQVSMRLRNKNLN